MRTRRSLCGNSIKSLRSRYFCARLCVLSDPCETADPCVLSVLFGSLGATLSLRTRVRDPASVPSCFFLRLPFLVSFFPFVFFHVCVFCSNSKRIYSHMYASLWSCTARPTLPSLSGDRFEAYYHPRLGACAVCHACVFRVCCAMFL